MVMMSNHDTQQLGANNISTGLQNSKRIANTNIIQVNTFNLSMESDETSLDEDFELPLSKPATQRELVATKNLFTKDF